MYRNGELGSGARRYGSGGAGPWVEEEEDAWPGSPWWSALGALAEALHHYLWLLAATETTKRLPEHMPPTQRSTADAILAAAGAWCCWWLVPVSAEPFPQGPDGSLESWMPLLRSYVTILLGAPGSPVQRRPRPPWWPVWARCPGCSFHSACRMLMNGSVQKCDGIAEVPEEEEVDLSATDDVFHSGGIIARLRAPLGVGGAVWHIWAGRLFLFMSCLCERRPSLPGPAPGRHRGDGGERGGSIGVWSPMFGLAPAHRGSKLLRDHRPFNIFAIFWATDGHVYLRSAPRVRASVFSQPSTAIDTQRRRPE
ncbi:hypothetical protein CRUP_017546 [Coryphaenoides rupestris]|nr:hypothetical protein CRUP_017546 [Coryphaenoides rupestris]